MIYVYAILAEAAALSGAQGLEDAPIEARAVGGLSVAVSEHRAAPDLSNDAILRHAQVVESLAEGGQAVLPSRLGVAFADDASLREAVAARETELRTALQRVRGCAEIGLRVLSPDAAEPTEAASGGAEYMRARLRQVTQRERVAEELHEVLALQARDSTRRTTAGGRLLLDAAYLVPREAVAAFGDEVRRIELSHPGLALVCTGPWPPYSFAPAAEAAL